jgi:EF-hand domain pair
MRQQYKFPLYLMCNYFFLEQVFSVETRRLFKRVLTLLIENEVASEILRKRTINRPFFTINDAFQALDREDKGYITADEFQLLLEDYGIFTTRRDVARLMDKYDKRQVGRVSYRDFLDETVPKSPRKY